eukprot:scaffold305_cov247-Pinguiococcus_pyrenoidosus.AAC.2
MPMLSPRRLEMTIRQTNSATAAQPWRHWSSLSRLARPDTSEKIRLDCPSTSKACKAQAQQEASVPAKPLVQSTPKNKTQMLQCLPSRRRSTKHRVLAVADLLAPTGSASPVLQKILHLQSLAHRVARRRRFCQRWLSAIRVGLRSQQRPLLGDVLGRHARRPTSAKKTAQTPPATREARIAGLRRHSASTFVPATLRFGAKSLHSERWKWSKQQGPMDVAGRAQISSLPIMVRSQFSAPIRRLTLSKSEASPPTDHLHPAMGPGLHPAVSVRNPSFVWFGFASSTPQLRICRAQIWIVVPHCAEALCETDARAQVELGTQRQRVQAALPCRTAAESNLFSSCCVEDDSLHLPTGGHLRA